MPNKMLIDASQPEETRVVVLRGNKVEEFDFESASRKQLRGNIYLAKVTRVEPSLQAAFVEYGGNRHGFLAFSEIHPDYYQIPVADRQALLEEEARAAANEEREEQHRHSRRHRSRDQVEAAAQPQSDETVSEPANSADIMPQDLDAGAMSYAQSAANNDGDAQNEQPYVAYSEVRDAEPSPDHAASEAEYAAGEAMEENSESAEPESGTETANEEGERSARRGGRRRGRSGRGRRDQVSARSRNDEPGEENEADQIENMGGDAMEELPYRAPRSRRTYKIQEVIKRRQVLLVQVVKEERGNKGAALTTYLSLAGRYSVLMPNTARGGGISRKITDSVDRNRLKSIVEELEVPEGMGVILRTAGASRTKPEVKRDFEYLMRMWETVRELTLKSSAPMLVYEEGSLIKRTIRDLYNKDIEDVVVAGEEAYREARDFMRMLMPSHAKFVKLYRDPQPIFAKAGAESQLDAMFSNQVTLKSGGYIVINQTEALVAIDVNSGRSTREHNIEDTALRTNLEAADEVARQLRLRDLAGLIVVDFIDMDENRNNRAVERRMKDALANDRARIQVGRISHFGLLELSRQRIRTGVLEGSTVMCAHCAGSGSVRSTASIALHVLRVLEDALLKNAAYHLNVRTRTEVALYILNQKREHLRALEGRFGVHVTILADDSLTGANYHTLERGELATRLEGADAPVMVRVDSLPPEDLADESVEDIIAEEEAETAVDHAQRSQSRPARSHERHGRRDAAPETGESSAATTEPGGEEGEAARRRRRRRRRRGGNGERNGEVRISANASQPSDEGLELMAKIGGDLPATPVFSRPDTGATETRMAEANPAADAAATGSPYLEDVEMNGAVMEDADLAEAAKAADKPRRSRSAKAKPVTAEATDSEKVAKPRSRRAKSKVAALADEQPVEAVPVAAPLAPAPVASPVPLAAPTPVITEAVEAQVASEPKPAPLPEAEAGPKRSGWWQRAKASFSGN
ncbi:MAG: ribonuclease E/G [Hyphomicrobiales bacterium]|nr:ribonuclease E/G [Hyphomicrobiales bacterium]MDE2115885.1 ribonuclease E/G [Hyphomicrobiales bacterium]